LVFGFFFYEGFSEEASVKATECKYLSLKTQ